MVNISCYIAGLLSENQYVVIPGVGALISTCQPAKIENDGTVLPPSSKISFHQEIKINDGLLADYIARKLKMPATEARKTVDQYASKVVLSLEQNGEAVFEEFGTLYLENDLYSFIPDESADLTPGSFGLKPVSVPESIRKVRDEFPEYHSKTRIKQPRFVFLLIFIPVLTGLIAAGYFIFRQNPHEDDFSVNNNQSEVVKDSVTIIREDTIPVTLPEPDSVRANIQPSHPRKELYYTIGGSFKSQENAVQYFDKMTSIGLHPIHLGFIGGFHLVALDTFLNINEAYTAAYSYSRRYPGTDAWVFHSDK